ncbi:MAG: hypothetical protein ACTHNK_14715 [Thermomicrobiales bacterium]|jgi:hypothetical protein|nr:hypothetical protein [Thermomicrobiales bacterium]
MARQWQLVLGCGLLFLAAWLALRGAAPVGAATIAGATTPVGLPALVLALLGGVCLITLLACLRARLSR